MIVALRTAVDVGRTMRSVAVVQGILTLLSFAMLLIVFACTDLSVALVFENSHSAKPFIYKVAGAWGNHEGSMLLWVMILAVAGAFLALFSRRGEERGVFGAFGRPSGVGVGFFSLLLVASAPLVRPSFSAPGGPGGHSPLLG